jgi:hypothetical protein
MANIGYVNTETGKKLSKDADIDLKNDYRVKGLIDP